MPRNTDIHQFKLETLLLLDDGIIAKQWDQELQQIALDCDSRALDNRPREITLKLTLTPITDNHGECVEVKSEFDVTSKRPSHRSRAYSMAMRRGGMLVFNNLSLGNANQQTLDIDDEE
jgi:hypothetical protein